MWLVRLVAYAAVAAIFLIVGSIAFLLTLAFTESPWVAAVVAVIVGGAGAAVPFVISSAADDVLDRFFPPRR